jgi:hypothetical protein
MNIVVVHFLALGHRKPTWHNPQGKLGISLAWQAAPGPQSPESVTVRYYRQPDLNDWITSSAPLDRVDLAKVIDQGSEERSRVMFIIGVISIHGSSK